MDVEKERRQELISVLGNHFECFEEVKLRHPTFRRLTLRADLIAIPSDTRFAGYAIAFEVKLPSSGWSMIDWCEAIKQASDYVYAAIEPGQPELEPYIRHRISAAFIFPAPPYDRFGTKKTGDDVIRDSEVVALSGALHLALHLRVGSALLQKTDAHKALRLTLGPNSVWSSHSGFAPSCVGLMTGKRSIGSRKVNVLDELN